MSQVSLGRPKFVPGTPPGHPDRQIPLCDFLYRFFPSIEMPDFWATFGSLWLGAREPFPSRSLLCLVGALDISTFFSVGGARRTEEASEAVARGRGGRFLIENGGRGGIRGGGGGGGWHKRRETCTKSRNVWEFREGVDSARGLTTIVVFCRNFSVATVHATL